MSLQWPPFKVEGGVPADLAPCVLPVCRALGRGPGLPSLDATRKDALRRGRGRLRPPCRRGERPPQPCHGPRQSHRGAPRLCPGLATPEGLLLAPSSSGRTEFPGWQTSPTFPDSAPGCPGGLRTPGTRSARKTSTCPVGEPQDVGLLSSRPPSATSE